jgi:hypothetical protein
MHIPNTRTAALPIGCDRTTATDARATRLRDRTEPCRRPQTTLPSSLPTRPTPMLALSRVLVSTRAHHAADQSVSASQMSRNLSSSAKRSCRRGRPRTAATSAPKLAQASASAMLTAKEHSQATKPCGSSLQTAATSGGGIRDDQTVERPHSCPAARTLPPTARANCLSITSKAPSSFPANAKGGTSSFGSTTPDSRNGSPCGKRELGEWEGSGAGAACVQVY